MKLVPALLLCVLTSACALNVDTIDVPYVSQGNISVVPGAQNARFTTESKDGRTVYKDRVGVKKNGYGMEMANIVSSNNIPQAVSDAVRQELESLGFQYGTGGAKVIVEVTRFYNDFKMGFFAGDAVAEIALNVQVVAPNGNIVYSRHYEGGAVEPNLQLATGSNARAALVAAFRNTIMTVYNDQALQQAIISAQPPARAPSS